MDSSFGKKLLKLTLPYFKYSEERWRARLLLAAIIIIDIAMVVVSIQFTYWFNNFYDALQALDKKAFTHQLWIFTLLAFTNIMLGIYNYYLTQKLQINWRRWLTERYVTQWLAKHAYYRMQILNPQSTDNPDQRISEDINLFTSLTLSLSMGLLSAICTLIAFCTLLWNLSGMLDIPLGHFGILHVPGYMLFAALLYAIIGTWLTYLVGKPLVQLNYNQQRYEADFRFSMVRLRENSESVALYHGEPQEHVYFSDCIRAVVANYKRIIKKQKQFISLNLTYNQLAIIFPVLVAAPRYFSKAIKLGGLMQIMKAFDYVHSSLSYIANSFTSIADWKAVVNRILRFNDAMENANTLQKTENIQYIAANDADLQVNGLSLQTPDGKYLVNSLNFNLKPGTRLLISGPSGSGKSTLIRALAGIWPFGSGHVYIPSHMKKNFIPQKVYLPLGSLRQVLNYPLASEANEQSLRDILTLCKLQHLLPQLENIANWYQTLSLGEQQRIAFARVLLQKPNYIFLDEATASLDEENERILYQTMLEYLPQATVISIGHRASLGKFHTQHMNLLGNGKFEMLSG